MNLDDLDPAARFLRFASEQEGLLLPLPTELLEALETDDELRAFVEVRRAQEAER